MFLHTKIPLQFGLIFWIVHFFNTAMTVEKFVVSLPYNLFIYFRCDHMHAFSPQKEMPKYVCIGVCTGNDNLASSCSSSTGSKSVGLDRGCS